jgi:hypothetical protein
LAPESVPPGTSNMRITTPFGDVAAFAAGPLPAQHGNSDLRHQPLHGVSAPN